MAGLSGHNAQVVCEKVSVVSHRRVVVRFGGGGGSGGNGVGDGGAVVGRTVGSAGGGSITRLTLPSKVRRRRRTVAEGGFSVLTMIDFLKTF